MITGSQDQNLTVDFLEQNGVGTSQERGFAPTCVGAFDCLFVLKMCGAIVVLQQCLFICKWLLSLSAIANYNGFVFLCFCEK